MTTTDQSTALATRQLSDKQIKQRIELNQEAGWGLEKGTPAQLNMVFLYCQKLKLLPGDEVTLYEGRPWITVDGRVTLMRRHPDYRGHSQRPLTKDEKELWGWDAGDIVIETTVRTAHHGEIQAFGRVSVAELTGNRVFDKQRLNPLAKAGVQPVEMAMKRSLSRGERFAFGTDSYIDDDDPEEAARVIIQERNDPKTVTANAGTYNRIYGSAYPDEPKAQPEPEPEERAEHLDYSPTQGELYDLYRQQLRAAKEEMGNDLDASKWVLRSDTPIAEIERMGELLSSGLESYRESRKAAAAQPPAESPIGYAMSVNKNLLDAAGEFRIPGLGKYKADESWPIERIEAANTALGDRIKERNGDAETAAKQDQVL